MNFKKWLMIEEAPAEKQTHVFDFDDTIAVTDSPNIVMFHQDGQPIHQSENDVINWLKQNKLNQHEILQGPNGKNIEYIPERKGYAAYVSSSGLAKIQTNYPGKESVVGVSEPPSNGPSVLIDFTASFGVNHNTTIPIKQTIDKIKKLNAIGADTMVLTARQGQGKRKSIRGHDVETTNKKDILNFLDKQGATPTDGVIGTAGGDKGKILYDKAVASKPENDKPEEIHFYDDLSKNTNNIVQTLGNKVDQDVYVYGPGDFASGQASVNRPSKVLLGRRRFKEFVEAVLAYDALGYGGTDPSWISDKKDILRKMYKEEPRKAMHQLKAWYNQVVDRNFIQSVTTIHYGEAQYIDKEIVDKPQDISCIGYLNPPYKNLWIGNCGIIVKGYVTLAGNNDLQTNQWLSSKDKRRKWSEYYRDFIIDKNNFVPPTIRQNEFLVSNWKPAAVVKSYSNYNKYADDDMTAEQLAEKHNLPLLGEHGENIKE